MAKTLVESLIRNHQVVRRTPGVRSRLREEHFTIFGKRVSRQATGQELARVGPTHRRELVNLQQRWSHSPAENRLLVSDQA